MINNDDDDDDDECLYQHLYTMVLMIFYLRSYIQTTAKSINISTLKETVAVLENMEVFILTLLLETIADITEVRN